MEHTTIAVKKDVKERLSEFALKKESYSDVIERLLKSAEQRLLHDILMNEEGTIPVKEALERARKKWQK